MNFLYKDLVNEDVRIFPEVKPVQLFKLPIKISDVKSTKELEKNVEQMINAKTECKDTNILEDKINNLVYRIYSITKDEIEIIEAQ